MKTITFYSYKGGVGRSLALANMATRLAEFGKRVSIIDFDLEAPGLPVKFEKEIKLPIKNGIVDYIYEYANKGILPEKIIDYSLNFELKGNKNITLIPAGNIEADDYWQKLSSIDWYNLVFQNANSISFFLDLKQKIKKELDPDFLLIDSRTGISEMSGITISLLADDIVIVSANNKENLTGSKRIIENLSNPDKAILGKVPKITFVLSRIPFSDIPAERGREQVLIAKVKKEIPLPNPNSFFVLHSDRDLEEDETIKISNSLEVNPKDIGKTSNSIQITKDYLSFFEHITEGLLNKKDEEKITYINSSRMLFMQAMRAKNNAERIEFLNRAIAINPFNIDAIGVRGDYKIENNDLEGGISDYERVIELDPQNAEDVYDLIGLAYRKYKLYEKAEAACNKIIEINGDKVALGYFGIGWICSEKRDTNRAIEYYTKAIENNYPDLSLAYNNRADSYRQLGDYDKASEDVFQSLAINPGSGNAYFTLAEIYASIGKINEFYLNLEIGLSKDIDSFSHYSLKIENIYSKFLKEERFIKLLDKYNIPLPSYEV